MPDISPYDERELFSLIASGDESAFRRIFYHCGAIIHPIVLKIVKDTMVSEDIIAEVFLKLWLNRSLLPGIENPSAWLCRVAANLSINYLRRNKLEGAILKKIYLDTPAKENDIDQQMSAKELQLFVKEAVATLPPQRRRIYELSREKGLSRQEIAQELQISENTVKNQLRLSLHFIQNYILKTYGMYLPCVFFFL